MDPEPSPRSGPRSTLSTLLEDLNRFFRSEHWSEDTVTSTGSATKLICLLTAQGAQNVGTQSRRHVTDPAWLVGVEGDFPHLQQTSVSALSVGHWHWYVTACYRMTQWAGLSMLADLQTSAARQPRWRVSRVKFIQSTHVHANHITILHIKYHQSFPQPCHIL